MAGTLIAYQGFRCHSAVYRNSRGFASDVSEVVFSVYSFPEGFTLRSPKPGDLLREFDPQVPSLDAIRTNALGRTPTSVGQLSLEPAGTLVMAESDDDDWQVVVHPLWVVKIERVQQDDDGGPAMVRVHLVDARHFFGGRGFLTRWSFNRARGDGTVATDSMKPDGKPFHLGEIAAEVAAALPRSPALAKFPDDWTKRTGRLELAPYCAAAKALAEVAKIGGALDPVLRLDGKLCLHRAGDGFVGYAPLGKGANGTEFDPAFLLSLDGTGQGAVMENGYPPDFVVTAGGERIATRAVDDWDPVLIVDQDDDQDGRRSFDLPADLVGERVVPLEDRVVRALTGGRHDLESLRRFVVMPAAYQQAGMSTRVCELLREQAWRLWRLPKSTKKEDGTPGENAHMLPLLERAEVGRNGRRLPLSVQIYRFGTQHRTMGATSPAGDKLTTARAQLSQIRGQVEELEAKRGTGAHFFDPGEDQEATEWLISFVSDSAPGVSTEDVNTAIRRLRQADEIRKLDPATAAAYERALNDEAKALDDANGTSRTQVLEIAKAALDLEQEARQIGKFPILDASPARILRGNNLFASDEAGRNAALAKFKEKVADQVKKIKEKSRATRERVASGVTSAELQKATSVQFVRNDPERWTDRGARLVSADLGIVHTSRLPGWIDPEGMPSQEAGLFTPKPVRVLFGTVARPRTDQFINAGTTQVRGGRVPAAAGDGQSYYAAAFRREADGSPTPIAVDAIPTGEGLVIERRDWVELVQLNGSGNRANLDHDALGLAAEQFARPVQVQERIVTLARPWPVNPDGVVASVEIKSNDDGAGFTTTVVTGGESAPDPNPMRTRVRPRRPEPSEDARRREGLEP